MKIKIHMDSKIYIYKKDICGREEHKRLTKKEAVDLLKNFFSDDNQTSFLFYKDGTRI